MKQFSRLRAWLLAGLLAGCGVAVSAASPKPNVVLILADDLGYGDVRCLNPESKIATPALDRLAAGGMVFTDAHSSSSVCTPTRYSLLTGRYNWRSRLKQGVMGGMSPPLIEPGRMTLAAFLKEQGYATACIGKWHLGIEWPRRPATLPFTDDIEKGEEGWRADFTQPIRGGPTSLGFDYYFGIAASLDMVPYTYIENDHVVQVPTVDKAFPMMLGRTNGLTRRGPAAAEFEAGDVLPTLTRKAVEYVRQHARPARAGKPFFLYLPLNAPHTPILPSAPWRGRSGLNAYADFVMETDASVGSLLNEIELAGLSNDTVVIFASDNGCSPEAGFPDLRRKGHDPSGGFRGAKADIFDGGHRIPLIVRWPGKVAAGSASGQLVCLMDMFATMSDVLDAKVPAGAAPDSISFWPVLNGTATGPVRGALVHHSINGSFAIRQGKWKLELCPDSGGWSDPRPGNLRGRTLPPIQLYDLACDPAETNNVYAAHPEVVEGLKGLLERTRAEVQ